MSEWQPIETAPKNGTRIIVFRPKANEYIHHISEDRWCKIGSTFCWARSNEKMQPTHWMPFPQPPK